MKTKSIFFSMLFAATAFALLSNCSGNKKEEATENHEGHNHADSAPSSSTAMEASAPQFTVDAAFQKQLSSLFTSYVAMKEAFVASDAAKVKEEATKTQSALVNVDMKLLSGAAHNDWMAYMKGMETSLKDVQSAGDIEAQRTAFSTLSDNLYKSIKAYGLGGTNAYYEFCPMAFNDQGGYWLSDNSTIRNPYFGDKMLSCGEVKEKLQ